MFKVPTNEGLIKLGFDKYWMVNCYSSKQGDILVNKSFNITTLVEDVLKDDNVGIIIGAPYRTYFPCSPDSIAELLYIMGDIPDEIENILCIGIFDVTNSENLTLPEELIKHCTVIYDGVGKFEGLIPQNTFLKGLDNSCQYDLPITEEKIDRMYQTCISNAAFEIYNYYTFLAYDNQNFTMQDKVNKNIVSKAIEFYSAGHIIVSPEELRDTKGTMRQWQDCFVEVLKKNSDKSLELIGQIALLKSFFDRFIGINDTKPVGLLEDYQKYMDEGAYSKLVKAFVMGISINDIFC